MMTSFPQYFSLKIHLNKHSSLTPLAKLENTELGGRIIFIVRQTNEKGTEKYCHSWQCKQYQKSTSIQSPFWFTLLLQELFWVYTTVAKEQKFLHSEIGFILDQLLSLLNTSEYSFSED